VLRNAIPDPSFFILLSLYVGGPDGILRIRRAFEPGSGTAALQEDESHLSFRKKNDRKRLIN
jgi:hypothetical protein